MERLRNRESNVQKTSYRIQSDPQYKANLSQSTGNRPK